MLDETHRIPTVQGYDITSEGPILPWLKLIVRPGKISHYYVGSMDGLPRLELMWLGKDDAHVPLLGSKRRDSPRDEFWDGPSLEALASSIEAWLATVDYPRPPQCDGSVAKGWHLSNLRCFGYTEFFVEPHWQEFHK